MQWVSSCLPTSDFIDMEVLNDYKGITTGYAMASYMGLAFFYAKSPAAQWRGPLALSLVWPVLMLVVVLFVPESPRWLLMVGREKEARDIVLKLHAVADDPDQKYARAEFYQMQKQTELDKTLNPTWLQMFTKASYRKRSIMACGFAFIGQSTAVLVINNYGPTVYKALGYGTLDQLILQCGWITVAIPSNFIGWYTITSLKALLTSIQVHVSWIGLEENHLWLPASWAVVYVWHSKPLWLHHLLHQFQKSILMVLGCVWVLLPCKLTGKPSIGLIVSANCYLSYIFLVFYGCGIDCAGVVFYSEIFPNHVRAKGVSMAVATIALTDLVYLQATATAFANIGWKFFLVSPYYSVLSVISEASCIRTDTL